jgi:hypothetical protein
VTQRTTAAARSAAIVVALLALPLAGFLVPVIPPEPTPVHVRWAEATNDAERRSAATTLGIDLITVREDGTWVVTLRDDSPESVKALVADPRVADTHNIDRPTSRLISGPRRTVAGWIAGRSTMFAQAHSVATTRLSRLDRLPLILLFAGALFALIHGFSSSSLRRQLTRGVPPLSAPALSAFRVALGIGLAAAVAVTDVSAVPHELQRSVDWLARTRLVTDVAASETAVTTVQRTLIAGFVLFAAGVTPRVMLAASALLLTLFTSVMLTRASAHDWSLPTVTVWLLLVVPWHEGYGLANWRRLRARPPAGATAARGLALWIPGLTIGLAFLAAAFAKLDTSGVDWVTGGAVRYHFVEDGLAAPLTWGLRIAQSDTASVLASFGAILVESSIWLVIWFRRPVVRLGFGLMAATILSGFYLFQGVAWPAWWALLLGFGAWGPLVDGALARLSHRDDGVAPAAATASAGVSRGALAVTGVFVLAQIAASALRVESEPLISDFPMYANTWPSRELFDERFRSRHREYLLSTDTLTAEALAERLRQLPQGIDAMRRAIDGAMGGTIDATGRRSLNAIGRAYAERYGEPLGPLHVVAIERGFDWERGAYEQPPRREPLGVLDPATGTLRPDE